MNRNIRIARILGIPIIINVSWVITLAFVTTMLALRFFPDLLPPGSRHHGDYVLLWLMAFASAIIFFGSILLHELAHSVVARRQGIPVNSITFFIFGGVSQIGGEARRPLYEFVMAVAGPVTSLALAGVFFSLYALIGGSEDSPLALVVEALFFMNLTVAVFNMAPGFPMDGGRVVRSILWGITGSFIKATRLATLLGRGLGYTMIGVGFLASVRIVQFIDPIGGVWFAILGLFLESSARQSWTQAQALDVLAKFSAEQIMSPELETVRADERLRYLRNRGGPRFIFFVPDDEDDRVVGVLTEREVDRVGTDDSLRHTAADVMLRPDEIAVGAPRDDGATMLQRMESDSLWHLPIVSEGRVIGVVSRERLLWLLSGNFSARPGLAG